VRIGADDRSGGIFHDVAESCRRIRPSQRADERRREDDVADESQPEEQDRPRRERYGSIVASSINMTGMSSLI
jgi:hypothetical protein